jgi:hypothetical protein
MPNKGNGS